MSAFRRPMLFRIIFKESIPEGIEGVKAPLQLHYCLVHEGRHIALSAKGAFAGSDAFCLAANIHFVESFLHVDR